MNASTFLKWYRRQPRWLQLGLCCLASALLTLTILISYSIFLPKTAADHPYLMFMFPVIVSAYIFGYRAGVLSLLITILYTDYFFLPSVHSLKIFSTEFGSTVLSLMLGLVVIWLIRNMRRAQANLEVTLAERQRELKQLEKAHAELLKQQGELQVSADTLKDSNQRAVKILERILDDIER